MALTLLTKSDIELELKYSFPASYTAPYFTELAEYARAEVYQATNRTTFTSPTEYLAKKAMICKAVEWISIFDPKIFQLYISNISENGASISFNSDSTLKNYEVQFNKLVAKLRLPGEPDFNIIMPDIIETAGTHSSDDVNVLY